MVDRLGSLNIVVVVVLVSDVVAVVVALRVLDEGLEVEVGQLVLNLEHNVLQELLVELGRASQDLQVAAMLGQASVGHDVVLVVSVNDVRLEPLVVSVADEALAVLEELGAVQLAVGAVVGSESGILAHGVLHERTAVIHLREDDLAASPLFGSEGGLVDVHDFVPGTLDVLIFELLLDRIHAIADHILGADLAIVDGLEGLGDGHFFFYN